MSTQDGRQIPLAISHNQSNVRLLELPSEILSLLSTDSPPILKFKSAENGHVALCLSDKTFQMRQVSTSNSVHIVQPQEGTDLGGGLPRITLIATSQCGSILELVDMPSTAFEYELRAALPVFDSSTSDDDGDAPAARVRKAEIYDNLATSDGEIDKAWTQVCAFEDSDGYAFVPSSRELVKTWSAFMSFCTINSVDAVSDMSSEDLGALEFSPTQRLVMQAIFQRISNSSHTTIRLCQEKTVRFVGEELMKDLVEVSRADLLRQWQNLLPESWRDAADTGILKDLLEDDMHNPTLRLRTSSTASQDVISSSSKTQRKWHDKFKKSRNR